MTKILRQCVTTELASCNLYGNNYHVTGELACVLCEDRVGHLEVRLNIFCEEKTMSTRRILPKVGSRSGTAMIHIGVDYDCVIAAISKCICWRVVVLEED